MNRFKLIYSFYFISGIIICLYFFYIRIILERLPKEIIFTRNIWSFILYLWLSCLFLYILKQQIYPKQSTNKIIILLKKYSVEKLLRWYNNSLKP